MPQSLLPAGIDAADALLLAAASLLTSGVTAALGIGGGILMLACMALIVPPAAVVPVHGVVQLGSNAGRTLLLARSVAGALTRPFLLGSLVGAALGSLVVVELPPAMLQTILALFILWSAWGRPPPIGGDAALIATGGVSSFLSMFVGATGPFLAATLKTLQLEPRTHVATHAACMTGQHLFKVAAFGLLGFAFADWMALIALMIATGFAGTWLGGLVLIRIDGRRFHSLLAVILTLLALRLLWQAATDFA